MRSKTEMLEELKAMLHDVFAARAQGASHPRMTHAQGFVDGYMRGMLETGLVTQKELLALVARERARVAGPATAEVRAPAPSLSPA